MNYGQPVLNHFLVGDRENDVFGRLQIGHFVCQGDDESVGGSSKHKIQNLLTNIRGKIWLNLSKSVSL